MRSVIMLMLNAIIQRVVMMNVIVLSVVMLNVIMLNVVAASAILKRTIFKNKNNVILKLVSLFQPLCAIEKRNIFVD
jgi:hypothetical protein